MRRFLPIPFFSHAFMFSPSGDQAHTLKHYLHQKKEYLKRHFARSFFYRDLGEKRHTPSIKCVNALRASPRRLCNGEFPWCIMKWPFCCPKKKNYLKWGFGGLKQKNYLKWSFGGLEKKDYFKWSFGGLEKKDYLKWSFGGLKKNDYLKWSFGSLKKKDCLKWPFSGLKKKTT